MSAIKMAMRGGHDVDQAAERLTVHGPSTREMAVAWNANRGEYSAQVRWEHEAYVALAQSLVAGSPR